MVAVQERERLPKVAVMNQLVPSLPPSGPAIEIADVIRGMWSRKAMVAILTLGAFLVSLAFVLRATPQYSTEAQVLVGRLDTPYDRVQPSDAADRPPLDDRDVISQMSVLSSQDLGERVIASLNLAARDEFDPLKKGLGALKRLMITLGFGSDPRLQTPEQRAMAHYNDELVVYQIPLSNVIAIRFTSGEPRMAADVANALAEVYVTATREAQSEPTTRARDWLSEEIDKLRKKVVDSEAAAEQFRAQSGLLKGAQATLGAQELSELNTQLILADAARSEAQARAKSIRDLLASKGTVDGSAEVLNSPLIQRLREQEAQLSGKLAELSVTYLPNHPKVIAVNSEIVKLQRQIRSEALKIVEGLEEQAKIAASRVVSLKSSLDGLKQRETTANIDDVKLRALEREAAANRQLLEALLNRYSDASARQQVTAQPGLARIIQRAGIPSSPAFPKSGPTVLLATLAGFALGLGLAFLMEIMAAAGRSSTAMPAPAPAPRPPEVAQPVLAAQAPPEAKQESTFEDSQTAPLAAELTPSLCELPPSADADQAMNNAFEVISRSKTPFAIAIRSIASWTISSRQSLGVRRLAVCAVPAGRHDSKACIAGLSRALVALGARVIVVDAAQSPTALEFLFGANPGAGLAEILTGQSAFSDVILKDEASDVHVLRAGLNRAAALGFMSSQRMDMVLDALDGAYDLVLVHTGDHTGLSATTVKRCHAALVISPPGHLVETARILHDLRQAGLRSLQYVRLGEDAGDIAPQSYPAEPVSA